MPPNMILNRLEKGGMTIICPHTDMIKQNREGQQIGRDLQEITHVSSIFTQLSIYEWHQMILLLLDIEKSRF
jgi:hypothetical protein